MLEIKVPYEVDGRNFEGVIVCSESSANDKWSVLFMQPDWFGVCEETIENARELAREGSVVLLADMFGVGYRSRTNGFEAFRDGMLAVHRNLPFTLECGGTAYRTLLAEAQRRGLIDAAAKRFAVGYCAGAGFLMEQARSGEDFDAVVLLHVTNPNPVVAGTPCKVKGSVLIVHGSADPVTPRAMIDELEHELTAAGAAWQTLLFGGAVHAFCVPSANFEGAVYDEKLCRRSYRMMRDFFAEVAADEFSSPASSPVIAESNP